MKGKVSYLGTLAISTIPQVIRQNKAQVTGTCQVPVTLTSREFFDSRC